MIGAVFEDGLSSPEPRLKRWRVVRVCGTMAEAVLLGLEDQRLNIPVSEVQKLLDLREPEPVARVPVVASRPYRRNW